MALPPESKWQEYLNQRFQINEVAAKSPRRLISVFSRSSPTNTKKDTAALDPDVWTVGDMIRQWNQAEFRQWVLWERTHQTWESSDLAKKTESEDPFHEMVDRLPDAKGLVTNYGPDIKLRHSAESLIRLDLEEKKLARKLLSIAETRIEKICKEGPAADMSHPSGPVFLSFLLFILSNIQAALWFNDPDKRANLTADYRDAG